ncbi:MAG: hypothetical protein ACREXS_04580 [Gammaproteobacteria bacterium]
MTEQLEQFDPNIPQHADTLGAAAMRRAAPEKVLMHSHRWLDLRAREAVPAVAERLADMAEEIRAVHAEHPDWDPLPFLYRELVHMGKYLLRYECSASCGRSE